MLSCNFWFHFNIVIIIMIIIIIIYENENIYAIETFVRHLIFRNYANLSKKK